MLVKVLIKRKVKPGKEQQFKEILRDLFTNAIHADGFISGETMQSTEDPSVHLTIGTWQSLAQWNKWLKTPERKKAYEMLNAVLSQPATLESFHYE